jgi:hypothetical protein
MLSAEIKEKNSLLSYHSQFTLQLGKGDLRTARE